MTTRTFTDDKGVVHTVMDMPVTKLRGFIDEESTTIDDAVVGHITITLMARKQCPHCDQLVAMHRVASSAEGDFVTLAHNHPHCAAWEATSDDVGLWADGMITP